MKKLETQFRQALAVYQNTEKVEGVKVKLPPLLVPEYESPIGGLLRGLPIVRNAEGKVAASLCFAEAARRKEAGEEKYADLGVLLRSLDAWTRSDMGYLSRNGVGFFNVLVPLPLYYKKKYEGIQYEEWDKQDPRFHLLVGKGLKPILSLQEEQVEFIQEFLADTAHVLASRSEAVSKARNSYAVSPILKLKDGRTMRLTPPLQHIVYQTWSAAPEARIDGAMVLDLFDWDKVPDPFPSISTARVVEKVAKELGTKETDFSNFGIPF